MRRIVKFVVVALLLLAATTSVTPVYAQTFSGTITGVVKDDQGGVLPGVSVTLTGKTGAKIGHDR